jgi:hypothetical protein
VVSVGDGGPGTNDTVVTVASFVVEDQLNFF